MLEPSELDKAQLKYEMRQLYRDIGLEGSLQALYEIYRGAELLLEVIKEESEKETHNG